MTGDLVGARREREADRGHIAASASIDHERTWNRRAKIEYAHAGRDGRNRRFDPWFDAWDEPADLYLLLDMDLPWVDDGTRLFGTPEERRRFFELSRAELERRGVRWALVGGSGEARLDNALAAIEAAGLS